MYNYNSQGQYSNPTTLGISEKWERVLCYLFLWVGGLILLFVEQRNETVRRHAKQSVLIFGGLSLLGWVVGVFGAVLSHIWVIGWLIGLGFGLVGGIIGIVTFVAWIILTLSAYFTPNTLFVGPRSQRYSRRPR